MTGVLLDANAIVSFLTDRHAVQRRKVHALFESAVRNGVSVSIPRHAVSETVFVLHDIYEIAASRVNDMLRALMEVPGVEIAPDPPLDEVLEVWPSLARDYGDAVILAAAKRTGFSVLTFDEAFIKIIKRQGIRLA